MQAAVEAVAACHELGLPIVSRGGGTSRAGQCTNEAVVIDFRKYCTAPVSVAPDARALESGCCGLAGNFGFTAGHGDVSRACAEQVFLPDSAGREAIHLAGLMVSVAAGQLPDERSTTGRGG